MYERKYIPYHTPSIEFGNCEFRYPLIGASEDPIVAPIQVQFARQSPFEHPSVVGLETTRRVID